MYSKPFYQRLRLLQKISVNGSRGIAPPENSMIRAERCSALRSNVGVYRDLRLFFGIALGMNFLSILYGATITIWQTGATDNSATNQTIVTVQGMACRIDASPEVTYLLDGGAGYVYQVAHRGKIYRRQPLKEFAAASPCGDATNTPSLTGRSNVVAGYMAFEYQLSLPCGSHVFWVAPDYPGWKKLRDADSSAIEIMAKAGFHGYSQILPGMVVRSESIMSVPTQPGNNSDVTTVTNFSTLVSASIVPDDPTFMQIPSDYQETQNFTNPPSNVEAPKLFEEQMALAKQLSSPNAPRMNSLANQVESGNLQQMATPLASADANVYRPPGTAASPEQTPGLPTTGKGTFVLAVTTWGQHSEQVTRTVVTNLGGVNLFSSNAVHFDPMPLSSSPVGTIGQPTWLTNSIH